MGQRLLLVDNDRRFIKDHQVALESAFDVDFLNSTETVVARLEGGDYAAALICVEVSENKGYALCSAIRKNPKLASMKVALISAKATEEEYARHRSLKGKADLYLHKPMAAGSLVASLSALVPPRAMDPDNPLGDLSGADLGDEWLESLKTELDTDEKPKGATAPIAMPQFAQPSVPAAPPPPPVVAPIVPVPPAVKTVPAAPSMATVAIPVPAKLQAPTPSVDAGKIALLEARVKDLEYKLQGANATLAQKGEELDALKNEHQTATRNLEATSGQSEERIAALSAQLEEVEGDHQRLRGTVEDLGRQLTAKEQEVTELQQTRKDQEWRIGELQALEGRVNEQQAELDRLRGAEQARQELDQIRQELERRVKELEGQAGAASDAERRAAEAQQESERREAEKRDLIERFEAEKKELLERLESGKQDVQIRLEAEKQSMQSRFDAEKQSIQERAEAEKQTIHNRLEEERQTLQSRLEFEKQTVEERLTAEKQAILDREEADKKGFQARLDAMGVQLAEANTEAEAARVDVAGLEATLRAQRRELANLENRLSALTRDNQSLQEKAGEHEAHLGQAQSLLQEREHALHAREEELAGLRSAEESARIRCGELEKELHQITLQHERQQVELLRGLDEKEATLVRLNATLESQRERINALDRERQEIEGHLNERTARLEALTGVITDMGNNIRRASDLTRPV